MCVKCSLHPFLVLWMNTEVDAKRRCSTKSSDPLGSRRIRPLQRSDNFGYLSSVLGISVASCGRVLRALRRCQVKVRHLPRIKAQGVALIKVNSNNGPRCALAVVLNAVQLATIDTSVCCQAFASTVTLQGLCHHIHVHALRAFSHYAPACTTRLFCTFVHVYRHSANEEGHEGFMQ
jgi:hypothetical protein